MSVRVRKKVSVDTRSKESKFWVKRCGGLVRAGSARVLYGVSRSEFRGSLTAVLVL